MTDRTACSFIDPASVLPPYDFQVNPDTEEAVDKSRSIDHTANTGRTGLVRQQGDETPLVWQYSGTFFHRSQLVAMLSYFEVCNSRTIWWADYSGDRYEVLFTSFQPTRKRTLRNPRDFANSPLWYWSYRMTLEVIGFVDGPYYEAGVSP